MTTEIQIASIIVLIFSVIIHEVSHGIAAYLQGDKTAEQAGRITLNPIPHIDLIGTILVPAMFVLSGANAFLAWAKPVPYNPNDLRNKKWGELIVAIAGPISNIILMILFILSIFILEYFKLGNEFILQVLFMGGFLNLFLAIFNLIPIVPLDGSKILFSLLPFNLSQKTRWFMEKHQMYIFIVFLLIIFNMNFLGEGIYYLYNSIFRLLF